MSSEEECDYMSETFVAESVKEDIRPGLIHNRTHQRTHNILKRQRTTDAENKSRFRPYRVVEAERREEGLNEAIGSNNRGFAILQKMGYTPGSGIGKSGAGLIEPISIQPKSGRQGLGREAELKQIASEKIAIRARLVEERTKSQSTNNFRALFTRKAAARQAKADLRRSQRVCQQLDADKFDHWEDPEQYSLSIPENGSHTISCRQDGRLTKKAKRRLKRSTFGVGETAKAIRMAVIQKDFPMVHLSHEQDCLIQDAVLAGIDAIPFGGPQPHFQGCISREGALLFFCSDTDTRVWMESIILNLKPWEGAELKFIEAKDLPQCIKITTWIPGAKREEPKILLNRLRVQNDGLVTEGWRILTSHPERKGQRLIFLVDEPSLKVIKNQNFAAFLNFTKIFFKVLGKGKHEWMDITEEEGQETETSPQQTDPTEPVGIGLTVEETVGGPSSAPHPTSRDEGSAN